MSCNCATGYHSFDVFQLSQKIFGTWVKALRLDLADRWLRVRRLGYFCGASRRAQADAHLLAHLGEKAELVL